MTIDHLRALKLIQGEMTSVEAAITRLTKIAGDAADEGNKPINRLALELAVLLERALDQFNAEYKKDM